MKQLSAMDYRNLPRPLKADMDEWLISEGLKRADIFHMEIVEDEVLVYEYLRNDDGKRYMDRSTNAPAQICRHIKYNIAPPEGAFR